MSRLRCRHQRGFAEEMTEIQVKELESRRTIIYRCDRFYPTTLFHTRTASNRPPPPGSLPLGIRTATILISPILDHSRYNPR